MALQNTSAHARLKGLRDGYLRLQIADQGLLLAVSGGADSTALLHGTARLAGELRLRLVVASIDHGLRAQSAHEVAEVARQAAELHLPFATARLGLEPGPGVEARARTARYEALEQLMKAHGLDAVATAHTASDQAETLLMRLSRGSALRGARGILARRGRVIRPMLQIRRDQVERFLLEQKLSAIDDPMNAQLTFLRARIRSGALPALISAAGKGAVDALARFAQTAAEDEALLSGLARAAYQRVTLREGVLDAVAVRALLPALQRRVLTYLVEDAGLPMARNTLEGALRALNIRGRAPLPGRLDLDCRGGQLQVVGERLSSLTVIQSK